MPLNGNGPRIIYLQINFPPHEFDVCDMGRYAETISEMMIWNDPYACINGLVMVQDYSKIGAKHMGLLSLSRIRQIFQFYTKCFPIQIKGIYYVNLSTFAYKSLKLLQPCVPETVRNQVSIFEIQMQFFIKNFPQIEIIHRKLLVSS